MHRRSGSRSSRESFKFFGSPDKDEDLRKTKAEIENNITKLLKLVKNEDQSKKNRNPKLVRREAELVGLIEDLNGQYQSLVQLCDYFNREFMRKLSRRRSRKGTGSATDSESEYFSPEELENYTKFSLDDALKNDEAKEYEEQLSSHMKEIESLSQQKTSLENQFEELSTNNSRLHDRVLELESMLKEEKGVVSVLEEKLKSNEIQANSNIEELMKQVDKLNLEMKTLHAEKDEREEEIKVEKDKAITEMKELMDKLNSMQEELDSLGTQNKELDDQVRNEREQLLQYLIQLEDLNKILAETSLDKQRLMDDKEQFLARIKDLEAELEAENMQKNALEVQLRDRSYDMKLVEEENKTLLDRNNELKKAMHQSGEELTALMRVPQTQKDTGSMEAMALKAEMNILRIEMDNLYAQRSKLEQQIERNVKEYEENLGNLSSKLSNQIAEQEKTIKEQAETIERINEEHKQAKVTLNKNKLSRQTAERKMDELAAEFRRKIEDNIRLLHRRIHVAEQMNIENKNHFKIARKRYEEENKMLGEKIARYEEELKVPKFDTAPLGGEQHALVLEALNELEMVTMKRLDSIVWEVEEQKKHVVRRVFKMIGEVQYGKEWIKRKNSEWEETRNNAECLKALLNTKEEQESLLREKVWKLEAKVSKEAGEKLNLMNAVSQLEKKVARLENILKEKEEDLVSLGAKKREAIKQLCFVVEFHRERCKDLKDLVIKMGANNNNTTNTRKNK
ncbi:hypothetical protein PIB30_056462 [Stylosanthes scabra]|uniref:NAB domain-containing protein n=1 Tax=Stylosanthes scabra TaxID=79078 RepID=A0ABU6XI11_9FABA|nr:hypothetical protein [Stylosanthes scabra]